MTDVLNLFIESWLFIILVCFVIYQIINHYNFKGHLDRVGREYCEEHDFKYVGIKHAKAHFSVIYKTMDSGKRQYQKFKMNTSLFGKVNFLEWLK